MTVQKHDSRRRLRSRSEVRTLPHRIRAATGRVLLAGACSAQIACGGGGESGGPTEPPTSTVASVEVSPGSASLLAGDTVRLSATARTRSGETVSGTITWATGNPAVASVSSMGLVTAAGSGTSTITASIGGKTGSAVITVIPSAVSQSVGAAGGIVSSPLPGGASVTVQVPAGAVGTSTLIGITPARPRAGELAKFALLPAGQRFQEPVAIVLDLASEIPAGQIAALSYRVGNVTVFVPLVRQTPPTRYAASVLAFGEAPVASAAARHRALPRLSSRASSASVTGDEVEVTVTATTLPAYMDSARTALTRMQANPVLANALRLSGIMYIVAHGRFLPEFGQAGEQLLLDWKAAICPAYEAAIDRVANLQVGSNFGFLDYFREIETSIAWEGAAQALNDPQLSLPFDGCRPVFLPAVVRLDSLFVIQALEYFSSTDGPTLDLRFDEFLRSHVPHLLQLIASRDAIGIQGLVTELQDAIARIFDGLRVTAWNTCRNRGDPTRIATLLAILNGTTDALSHYPASALIDDAEECGTNLDWHARRSDGSETATGVVGGVSAGNVVRSAPVVFESDHGIVIKGLLQPIQCPGDIRAAIPGWTNDEVIRLVAQTLNGRTVIGQRTLPLGGPGTYLHNDSIVVTASELRTAVNLPDADGGIVQLLVERVGNTCQGGFIFLPATALLVRFDVTLSPAACPAPPAPRITSGTTMTASARTVRRLASAPAAATSPSECGTIDGDVTIRSQADFAQLDRIARINGSLTVQPLAPGALTTVDLQELALLTEVTGAITIRAMPTLQRLSGLRNVARAGSLWLSNLPALTDASAIQMRELALGLRLDNLPLLGDLSGFDIIEHVGSLHLEKLPLVTSLAPLRNTRIDGLRVFTMAGLTAISDLDALSSTLSTLEISDNAALTALPSLASVTNVAEDLNVTKNPLLPGLTGLENLRTVGGFVGVSGIGLTSLAGLAGLQRVGTLLDILWDNAPSLSSIAFPSLLSVGTQMRVLGSDQALCPSPRSLTVQLPALASGGGVVVGVSTPPGAQAKCSVSVSIPTLSKFTSGLQFSGRAITSVTLASSLTGPGIGYLGTSLTRISLGAVSLGALTIRGNPELSSLGGGSGAITGRLEISSNPQLSTAAANAWALQFNPVGSKSIFDNKVP